MAFGANTDYFGLADAGVWELQGSSATPESSAAQVANNHGDVVAESEYEKTQTVETSYRLVGNGALGVIRLPADFQGGHIATLGDDKYIITGGSLTTSNTERPLLTVTGEKMHGDEAAVKKYDFAGLIGDISARKLAQEIGFELVEGGILNSCSVSFSLETARGLNASGAIAILDVFNGRAESTGDLVSAGTIADVIAASGWTVPAGTARSEENTAHPSGSITVYKNILPTEV